jgi:hypothetical protein
LLVGVSVVGQQQSPAEAGIRLQPGKQVVHAGRLGQLRPEQREHVEGDAGATVELLEFVDHARRQLTTQLGQTSLADVVLAAVVDQYAEQTQELSCGRGAHRQRGRGGHPTRPEILDPHRPPDLRRSTSFDEHRPAHSIEVARAGRAPDPPIWRWTNSRYREV